MTLNLLLYQGESFGLISTVLLGIWFLAVVKNLTDQALHTSSKLSCSNTVSKSVSNSAVLNSSKLAFLKSHISR